MTAAVSSSNAGARTAKTSNNAKTSKGRAANTTKGQSKKRQKTRHTTVDAMPDPRAPKKARSGYELFLLAGGIELHAGNIISKKVRFICQHDCSRWMHVPQDTPKWHITISWTQPPIRFAPIKYKITRLCSYFWNGQERLMVLHSDRTYLRICPNTCQNSACAATMTYPTYLQFRSNAHASTHMPPCMFSCILACVVSSCGKFQLLNLIIIIILASHTHTQYMYRISRRSSASTTSGSV